MMFSSDLRRDFSVLHALYEEHRELGRSDQDIAMRRIIRSIKGRIRRTIQEQNRHAEEDAIWHYNIYDDQRWCKFVYDQLPEEWQTDMTREEAIEEYKKDEWWHWYNPWDDGRDCTGVWFTNWIAVFPIPELHKTIVYHSQSCDV